MTIAGKRARRAEDKQARRQDILDAALALLAQRRFAEIKMIDIAQHADLAKGTVFLYFPTKEALFLELLEQMLAEWLTEVNAELDTGKGRWTSARVARLFTDTLIRRDQLTRMLTLVSSVLEQNVDVERIVTFKQRLKVLLGDTGARLERRLTFLAPGEGMLLIFRIYALVVGLRQLSDPGELATQALARPELAGMSFDFEPELRSLLSALLRGLELQPRG